MAESKNATRESREAEEELEDLFSDVSGTVTVKIERLEPEWCSGYCGIFHVTAGKPLRLEEVRQRFGGRVFQMTAKDSGGKYVKKKVLRIDDVPRRENVVINRDGTTDAQTQKKEVETDLDPFIALLRSGLPPAVIRKMVPSLLGMDYEPKKEAKETSQMEMLQTQMVMDMMNSNRTAQMEATRQAMEMQREMQRQRAEMNQNVKPADALGDVNHVVKLLRELNSMKSEFGGGGESATSEVLQNTMPLLETLVSEFISLKKLQAQAEISKIGVFSSDRPALPSRTPKSVNSAPKVISDKKDPVQLAREMGAMFRGLDDDLRQRALNAFLGQEEEENMEENAVNDILDDEEQFLTTEDQELLDREEPDNHSDETDHISDSGHARSAIENDPPDRSGNSPGFPVLAD
jgi:hypothetical protein